MKTTRIVAAATLMTQLFGCASSTVAPIHNQVSANGDAAKGLMQQAQHGDGAVGEQKKTTVAVVKGLWIPTSAPREAKAEDTTTAMLDHTITVNKEFRTIAEVAEMVTHLTGIPVIVSPDTAVPANQQNGQNGVLPGATGMPGMPTPMNGVNSNCQYGSNQYGGAQPGQASQCVAKLVPITFDGKVSGFLNMAAAHFGVSWERNGQNVTFFRYQTKTYHVVGIPGDSTLQNTISTSSGGSSTAGGGTSSSSGANNGASGGSSSTTGAQFSSLSIWTALADSIKTFLSPSGKVTVTAATSTVTVTDTPEILARVDEFMKAQNESLSKQVVVNVRVLSVDLSDSDEYGINWNAMYQSLSGNIGAGLSNAFTAGASDSSLALKVLAANAGPNSQLSAFKGTQAIISALSQQGKVSEVTSVSLTTLNNQPAPLQVGQLVSYIASCSLNQTANVGSSNTVTPGTAALGFNMSIVPNIGDQGRLALQYSINISTLLSMNSINSGGCTIQSPNIDTRNFLQKVILHSGDTMVMTGFEQSAWNATTQGVGNPSNWALGGGVSATRSHNIMVILVQPIVGDN